MSVGARHQLIPAVWIFLTNDKDEYFLLRRANTGWEDGKFTVPAGHLEPMESPRKAGIRELYEETGVTASEEDLEFCHVIFNKSMDGTGTERVGIFFVLRRYEGTPYLAEPGKASESGWYDKDSLPTLVKTLEYVIPRMSEGKAYSELYY